MRSYDMVGYGFVSGWRAVVGTGGSMVSTAREIGMVVLDIQDIGMKQLWRGMASKMVDAKAKPDKRQKNIDKAAVKMLKNNPPKE